MNGRLQWIDSLRGLAILLMLLDHALSLVSDLNGTYHPVALLVRLTLTRLAMPMFMLVAGYCFKGNLNLRRFGELVVAACLANVAFWRLGWHTPDIVALFVIVALLSAWIHRYPVAFFVVGIIQAMFWRYDSNVYQIGAIVCCVSFGVLLRRLDWQPTWVPSGFERVGRYPLTWYVGHLLVFAVIVDYPRLVIRG